MCVCVCDMYMRCEDATPLSTGDQTAILSKVIDFCKYHKDPLFFRVSQAEQMVALSVQIYLIYKRQQATGALW